MSFPQTSSLLALLGLILALGTRGTSADTAPSTLGLPPLSPAQTVSDRSLISLGQKIFSDSRFSREGTVSCATCHKPELAFSDGLARSVGTGGAIGTRNAPSLLNVVYMTALFWDGRAATLEMQALAPLTNPIEHALAPEDRIANVARHDPVYRATLSQQFHVASNEISTDLVVRAIAAYERSLRAGGSSFDRFLYGNDKGAMSPEAIRGMELFRGRAGCVSCHTIEPTFAMLTDQQYHSSPLGLPPGVNTGLAALSKRVAAAAGAGRQQLETLIASDADIAALGRFIVTLTPADIGRFRTPSLRNVAVTAPYMHDGSVMSLDEAIELELYGRGTNRYPISLTTSEKRDLHAFLGALTSPECLGSDGIH